MRYRALLAAIDDYGSARNNLPSCVNDLRYVHDLLRGPLKVPDSQITRLVNSEVTAEGVRKGLEWLTRDPSKDERLLFFFSGHGYQIARSDGSMDEALVLSGNEFFLDDKLVECAKAAKPGTLTVLLDCCFGGGNDKFFLPTGTFGALAKPKRWSPPDAFLDDDLRQLAKGQSVPIASYKPFCAQPVSSKVAASVVFSEAGMTRWPTAVDEAGQASINGVLLAACLEDETASASTAQTPGLSAFTFALKRVIEQHGVDLTLQDIRDRTDRALKGLGFRQTSTLKIGTGPIDRDSRFLSLQRKAGAASWSTDRRIDMSDTKFVEVLVERVIRELTQKGYQPVSASPDKFFPGIEIIAPIIIDRVIDELTKKSYKSQSDSNGSDKSLLGDIARDVVERTVRELIRKDFSPPSEGADKFGLGDVAGIIIRELTKQGYAPNGGKPEKFLPPIDPIVSEVVRHFSR